MFERILKKKDDYAEKHGLMGNADDYNIYHMTWKLSLIHI